MRTMTSPPCATSTNPDGIIRWAAARRVAHQAARINGIDGHVGLDRGVDGSFQLGLILNAGLADAVSDVDQHLLFGKRRELVDDVLNGGELLIGVEYVELGFIGDEGRAGILVIDVAGIGQGGHFAHLADGEGFDDGFELLAIGGEIGFHLNHRGVDEDGHQIGFRHLRVDVVQRGVLRAKLLGDAHVREIEEEHQKALVVILDLLVRGQTDGGLGVFGQRVLIFERRRRLGRLGIDG